MVLKVLDPVVHEEFSPGWAFVALESGRTAQGLTANVALYNGTLQHSEILAMADTAARAALVQLCVTTTGIDAATITNALLTFLEVVERATRERDRKPATSRKPQDYIEDMGGFWLVTSGEHGEQRVQVSNFTATITADVVEDDGSPETRRFFEIEATHDGMTASVRVAARDFHSMAWVAETLGAKARLYPQPYMREHAAAAIQDLSDDVDHRYVYIHTGWRRIDGVWHYLHGTGAITAAGETPTVTVGLSDGLARYQLPAPPTGQSLVQAIRASLALRHCAPGQVMIPVTACAYLAPLRPFLAGEPPDLTVWLVGPSGQFKSEYAALALAHFGPFTRLTLPASFTATANGLERLCFALKDSLLVVDDFHPAGDRRQAEAMQQAAGRLLRGIGNQAGRQRMRADTTMRSELPPRCLVLATGERLPQGHSTNARMFLVPVPKLKDDERQHWGAKLATAQTTEVREQLALAMAGYVQWLAANWARLEKDIPARFQAYRTAAYQAESHAREPSQVAYLQLGWSMFTEYATSVGALTSEERDAVLKGTLDALLQAASEHGHALQTEATIPQFLALLTDGFSSKTIYARSTADGAPPGYTTWGWTTRQEFNRARGESVPVAHEGHAALIGYVDDEYIYLIPLATEAYLQDASRRTGKVWPVDMTTLLKELEEAGHIYVKPEKDRMRREPKKKIKGQSKRYIWLKRATLGKPDDPDDTPADISGTTPRREPGDEPPDPDPAPTPDLFNDDIPF